jgi:hypothetical protein
LAESGPRPYYAIAQRKLRVNAFREFIEANRRSKNRQQILAEFSLENGIRIEKLLDYLDVFYQVGIYHRPQRWYVGHDYENYILTNEEYEEERSKISH